MCSSVRTSVSDSTDFCGSAHHVLALILANVLKGQLAWGKASDCKFAFDLEFGGGGDDERWRRREDQNQGKMIQ